MSVYKNLAQTRKRHQQLPVSTFLTRMKPLDMRKPIAETEAMDKGKTKDHLMNGAFRTAVIPFMAVQHICLTNFSTAQLIDCHPHHSNCSIFAGEYPNKIFYVTKLRVLNIVESV
ncbi:hypothetical protein AB6A40_002157 [Gnathostoma spinigerum]|uniref:Uncharacterized protein n=1 Tax=Gnathostoma spinigerum TaxID=75299 RepID=A0ABD6EEY5_9BILA